MPANLTCRYSRAGLALPGSAAPVAVYHMEETGNPIVDSQGTNDGSYNGSDFQALGRFMYALEYDGTDDRTTITPTGEIDFKDSSFTIEMWVNQRDDRALQECVFTKPEGGNNQNLHLRIYNHGQIRIDWYADATDAYGVYTSDKLNEWHHLGFTYDYGTATRRIFLDGAIVGEETGVAPYQGTGGTPRIGSWSTNEFFSGRIDEPRIYNTALDPATMALHADGQYEQYQPRVPILVMHMEDGASPIADATGAYSGDYNGTGFHQAGKSYDALRFDGDDRVLVDSDGVLDFDNRSFTIEMWVNQDLNPAAEECIVSKTDEGGNDKNMHLRIYNSGQIRMDWYGNALDTATGIFQPGDWHHLAFTYDYDDPTAGTGIRRIYYDGGMVGEQLAATPYLGTGGNFYLGTWGNQFFTGLMDEARVYNYALDATDVLSHFNLEYGAFQPVPEPAGLMLAALGLLGLTVVKCRRRG